MSDGWRVARRCELRMEFHLEKGTKAASRSLHRMVRWHGGENQCDGARRRYSMIARL